MRIYSIPHHGRGLPGHLDGVSSVGEGHLRPVQDIQTGIQDSIVKLEKKQKYKNLKINNSI